MRNLEEDEVKEQFNQVFEETIKELEKNRKFQKPVDVAIDIHDWLYYGKKDTNYVANTNPAQGTSTAYKFATLCVVEDGKRFTIDAVLFEGRGWKEKTQAVKKLVQSAKKRLDIKHAYLDRGYYTVHVIKTLKELGVDFLVRASKSTRIRRKMKGKEGEDKVIDSDYEMERRKTPTAKVEVIMFATPHADKESEFIYFVTNLEVTEHNAKTLAERYRRR